MGCGKVFLTSRKFLSAEGGFRRLVWMPKELKELLAADLKLRFKEQGVPDLLDLIADETVATETDEVRKYLEKVGHPAIQMKDMAAYAHSESQESEKQTRIEQAPAIASQAEKIDAPLLPQKPEETGTKITPEMINELKLQISKEISEQLKFAIGKEIVKDIISTLSEKYLGEKIPAQIEIPGSKPAEVPAAKAPELPSASERLSSLQTFKIKKDKCETPVWTVKLGATKKEGGTRGKTYAVGGASCMPFHLWEGEIPNRPLVAMEVFDVVSEKYPQVLRNAYGDLLANPAKMAKACVEKHGADLISVRLDGTHPEKGNRSPEESVRLVKSVLEAVDVPLIITGHNNFDKNNEVMKAITQACAGENLLLNWVEQNNYRTIAGAALGYRHSLVAQSPIDVNIGKQLNILLTNMDVKLEQIVIDPMTGSVGYGIEYTYSVMERIRYTGIMGDKMLAGPMIVSPGQECAKTKELRAEEKDFPAWGDLRKRAATWEYVTAASLLYSGADILIMYNPDAAVAIRKTISKLMGKQ
jgi:acetyl-CoA decarbonylase/synthase complex subunit delta